jgi:hypothetical protein
MVDYHPHVAVVGATLAVALFAVMLGQCLQHNMQMGKRALHKGDRKGRPYNRAIAHP